MWDISLIQAYIKQIDGTKFVILPRNSLLPRLVNQIVTDVP